MHFFDKAIHRQYFKNQHHMYRNSSSQSIGISPFKPALPPRFGSQYNFISPNRNTKPPKKIDVSMVKIDLTPEETRKEG